MSWFACKFFLNVSSSISSMFLYHNVDCDFFEIHLTSVFLKSYIYSRNSSRQSTLGIRTQAFFFCNNVSKFRIRRSQNCVKVKFLFTRLFESCFMCVCLSLFLLFTCASLPSCFICSKNFDRPFRTLSKSSNFANSNFTFQLHNSTFSQGNSPTVSVSVVTRRKT